MQLLYLDYNCFQRRFDDLRQERIRREAEACDLIFSEAAAMRVELVWSFMHADEGRSCPFLTRRLEAMRLASVCAVRVAYVESIGLQAAGIQRAGRLSAKDALHVASALHAGAGWFLTCDDQLRRRASRLDLGLPVCGPVAYVASHSLDS